ncbi:MAG: stalk domain-containing protein [Dethiobacteria bacterium]|jgi:hypothetical protein
MYLKKYKMVVIGIIVGVLCALPVGALAGWVSVLKDGDIVFKFNGQTETLPPGYTALFYKDRIYVPIRFIAERLGAEVSWDQLSKIVSYDTKPDAECLALQKEIQALEKEIKELKLKIGETETQTEGQPAGNYQSLPISRTLADFNIAVTGLIRGDYYTRIYLKLENKKPVPLQLLQTKTKAIVDGKEYKTSDIMHYTFDQRWYNDILHETTEEGYVMLPLIPENSKEMFLELTLLYNDLKQETTTVEFAIKLDS